MSRETSERIEDITTSDDYYDSSIAITGKTVRETTAEEEDSDSERPDSTLVSFETDETQRSFANSIDDSKTSSKTTRSTSTTSKVVTTKGNKDIGKTVTKGMSDRMTKAEDFKTKTLMVDNESTDDESQAAEETDDNNKDQSNAANTLLSLLLSIAVILMSFSTLIDSYYNIPLNFD